MHNSVGVAVSGSLQYLVSKFLDGISWQRSSDASHVLFEVELAEFEDQVEIVLLVNDFFQTKGWRSEMQMITYSTTLGCLMPLSREISLIAVLGTPSSSFSSLIFLMATT